MIVQNIVFLAFFFISSLLLNQNWVLTATAIVIDMLGAIIYFTASLDIMDIGAIF